MNIIEIAVFIAFLWICWLVWEWLSRSGIGRAVQVSLVSTVYAIWLSVYPFAVVMAVRAANESYDKGNGVGVAIGSVSIGLFAPLGLFSLIPWNFFGHWVWIKAGLQLPQSERLGGARPYRKDAVGRRY
jgi:hypothetical protein